MYRDDTCAVCGESLPPDHFYCREHAATVDDRLHAVGERLARVVDDLAALAPLLGQVAQETYDWLAEDEADDPDWPPAPVVALTADAEEVDVDVDVEPGRVLIRLEVGLAPLVAALAQALEAAEGARFAAACRRAEGGNATH